MAENNGLKLPREFGLLLKQVKLQELILSTCVCIDFLRILHIMSLSLSVMSPSVINCMTQEREQKTVYFDSKFHFFFIYSCHTKLGFILRPIPEAIGANFGSPEGRKSSRQL